MFKAGILVRLEAPQEVRRLVAVHLWLARFVLVHPPPYLKRLVDVQVDVAERGAHFEIALPQNDHQPAFRDLPQLAEGIVCLLNGLVLPFLRSGKAKGRRHSRGFEY